MSKTKIDHTDKETLERLYLDEGMSQTDIGELAGVHFNTVGYHMKKYGIETRTAGSYEPPNKQLQATYRTTKPGGYEKWHAWYRPEDTVEVVAVHRLLAVAEYGFDAVVDKDVHHENEIPWDNRPENITPMSKEEHIGYHHRGEKCPNSKLTESDVREIRQKLKDTDMEHKEIANEYGVSPSAIRCIKTGKTWSHVD